MLNKDFILGFVASLVLFAIVEGIALLVVRAQNRKLQIAKIYEDAHDTVEKLTDDELKTDLYNDLK